MKKWIILCSLASKWHVPIETDVFSLLQLQHFHCFWGNVFFQHIIAKRQKTKNDHYIYTHHFFPGNYFSKVLKLFGHILGDIILCVFKTKASRGMKLYSYFYFYSVLQHMKDKRYRINRSEFYEWLFGPKKFSGLSRNGPWGLFLESSETFRMT